MVLSGTKKTSSIASITNQNSGGGSKKAGLPATTGRGAWVSIALNGTKQNMAELKVPTDSKTSQSRPTGSRPNVSYWL
jgi:hypothetical protein